MSLEEPPFAPPCDRHVSLIEVSMAPTDGHRKRRTANPSAPLPPPEFRQTSWTFPTERWKTLPDPRRMSFMEPPCAPPDGRGVSQIESWDHEFDEWRQMSLMEPPRAPGDDRDLNLGNQSLAPADPHRMRGTEKSKELKKRMAGAGAEATKLYPPALAPAKDATEITDASVTLPNESCRSSAVAVMATRNQEIAKLNTEKLNALESWAPAEPHRMRRTDKSQELEEWMYGAGADATLSYPLEFASATGVAKMGGASVTLPNKSRGGSTIALMAMRNQETAKLNTEKDYALESWAPAEPHRTRRLDKSPELEEWMPGAGTRATLSYPLAFASAAGDSGIADASVTLPSENCGSSAVAVMAIRNQEIVKPKTEKQNALESWAPTGPHRTRRTDKSPVLEEWMTGAGAEATQSYPLAFASATGVAEIADASVTLPSESCRSFEGAQMAMKNQELGNFNAGTHDALEPLAFADPYPSHRTDKSPELEDRMAGTARQATLSYPPAYASAACDAEITDASVTLPSGSCGSSAVAVMAIKSQEIATLNIEKQNALEKMLRDHLTHARKAMESVEEKEKVAALKLAEAEKAKTVADAKVMEHETARAAAEKRANAAEILLEAAEKKTTEAEEKARAAQQSQKIAEENANVLQRRLVTLQKLTEHQVDKVTVDEDLRGRLAWKSFSAASHSPQARGKQPLSSTPYSEPARFSMSSSVSTSEFEDPRGKLERNSPGTTATNSPQPRGKRILTSNTCGTTVRGSAGAAASSDIAYEVPVCTYLTEACEVGSLVLNVVSQAGFSVGSTIKIADAAHSEIKTIASFGSLIVATPLAHSYDAGASVKLMEITDEDSLRRELFTTVELSRSLERALNNANVQLRDAEHEAVAAAERFRKELVAAEEPSRRLENVSDQEIQRLTKEEHDAFAHVESIELLQNVSEQEIQRLTKENQEACAQVELVRRLQDGSEQKIQMLTKEKQDALTQVDAIQQALEASEEKEHAAVLKATMEEKARKAAEDKANGAEEKASAAECAHKVAMETLRGHETAMKAADETSF